MGSPPGIIKIWVPRSAIPSMIATARADDQFLNGEYRIDFHGAFRTYNTVRAPTIETSATYRFTTNCTDGNCIATGTLLSSTEDGIFVRPTVTLYWAGLAWRLVESIDTPCARGAGTRSQELIWSLTPQRGSDVLAGVRSITTTRVCAGDDAGLVVEPALATPVS